MESEYLSSARTQLAKKPVEVWHTDFAFTAPAEELHLMYVLIDKDSSSLCTPLWPYNTRNSDTARNAVAQ